MVTREKGCAAVLLAACLVGMAACSAAIPTPTQSGILSPTPRATETVVPAQATPAPTATAPASPTPDDGLAGLGTEITVERVDPTYSETILEFASDGASVLFSSGFAEDSGPEHAPDLWSLTPGSETPELLWRNPERDHSIISIAGDVGTVGFVDIPLTGERAWNLWLLPRGDDEAILLDRHPGDDDVSGLIPSFSVFEGAIVWTAFDRGPAGPVSQMLVARAPNWEPRVVRELLAAEAEVWLPSLLGTELVYMEVHYSADRETDERRAFLTSLGTLDQEPLRLDTSGLATMPLLTQFGIVWKEADPGFNMFNWGKMYRYDQELERGLPLDTSPQEYVNYPSAGSRFVTWRGSDSSQFGVYDLVRDEPRLIESHPAAGDTRITDAHIAGDLIVWVRAVDSGNDTEGEFRFAFLPNAGADRPGAP